MPCASARCTRGESVVKVCLAATTTTIGDHDFTAVGPYSDLFFDLGSGRDTIAGDAAQIDGKAAALRDAARADKEVLAKVLRRAIEYGHAEVAQA